MVRVKPEAIRGCEDREDYWVVNGTTDEIRPYRILYKECKEEEEEEEQKVQLFNNNSNKINLFDHRYIYYSNKFTNKFSLFSSKP